MPNEPTVCRRILYISVLGADFWRQDFGVCRKETKALTISFLRFAISVSARSCCVCHSSSPFDPVLLHGFGDSLPPIFSTHFGARPIRLAVCCALFAIDHTFQALNLFVNFLPLQVQSLNGQTQNPIVGFHDSPRLILSRFKEQQLK